MIIKDKHIINEKSVQPKNEDLIPVFMAADDNYAPFTAVTAVSIMENTNSNIAFYILDNNISPNNKKNICQSLKKYSNCSIEFISIDNKLFANFPEKYHYTRAMYSRYIIPQIIPNLKKTIYTDVDVVFLVDIKEFYNINLDGYGLAAPIEEIGIELDGIWNHKTHKKRLNIPDTHKLFQSGNLLIDCEYWREHNITEKLFSITEQYQDRLITPDLDALNIAFTNNYKKLDYKYSVCVHFIRENFRNNPIIIEGEENPYIIHYSGKEKPWNINTPFKDYFWKYARKTKFFNKLFFKFIVKNRMYYLQNILSLKNEYSKNGQKKKVLTIMFIKLKFK